MKIVHKDFEYNIKINEDRINLIVIENKKAFLKYTEEIYNQCNISDEMGDFVLSDDKGKELKISKCIDIIIDFYSIDINNKKILTKLYNQLSSIANENEMYIETGKINSRIIRYIDLIINESDYPLEYNIDFNISDLFKITGIKFDISYENTLEKICDYMDVSSRFLGKKIFVFVNIRTFFEKEEIIELYNFAKYNKIFIIMIENEISYKIDEYENVFILDKDLCEIY